MIIAARLSFWLPWVVLALLGLLQNTTGIAGLSPGLLFLPAAVLLGGAGLALFTLRVSAPLSQRRDGLLGMGSAALAALVMVMAIVPALWERRQHTTEAARMSELRHQAVGESAGWAGRATTTDGLIVVAREVDAASAVGAAFAGNFTRPFKLLLLAAGNHGSAAAELDLSMLTLLRRDGGTRSALPRAEILASARAERAAIQKQHGGPYQLPAGGRLGQALAFLDPAEDLEAVVAVVVKVNGAPLRIPGRYLSAADKRAKIPLPGRRELR